MRTCLYRHASATSAALYVGISSNPVARTAEHKKSSPWFGEVAHVSFEWFDAREDAERAERMAIRNGAPKYNRQHSSIAKTTEPEGTFRAGLLVEMARTGVSIAEIVTATGISRDAINKLIYRENASTTVEKAVRISAFFGMTVTQMIDLTRICAPTHDQNPIKSQEPSHV